MYAIRSYYVHLAGGFTQLVTLRVADRLLQAQQDAGHGEGDACGCEDGSHRITSYNVCYTKLLRDGAFLAEFGGKCSHRQLQGRTDHLILPIQLQAIEHHVGVGIGGRQGRQAQLAETVQLAKVGEDDWVAETVVVV